MEDARHVRKELGELTARGLLVRHVRLVPRLRKTALLHRTSALCLSVDLVSRLRIENKVCFVKTIGNRKHFATNKTFFNL